LFDNDLIPMRPPSAYDREVAALSQLEFSRFFDRLTLQQLAGYVALSTFTRRSAIYRTGEDRDAVYGLVSGHVKLTREDEHGGRVLLEILPPGTVFGEDALFTNGRRERTALAHDMVMVVRLGKSDVLRMMNEFPRLNEYFFRLVGERLLRAEERICDLSLDGIASRLAKVLLDLATRYGTPQENGGRLISLRIPHRELADLVGSTRESVTMHLNDLRRREIVEFSNRRILILNPPALTTQAQTQSRRADTADQDESDDE
jgi:CRP/FNR family cyclic AMP-dependent transcriptional regulator